MTTNSTHKNYFQQVKDYLQQLDFDITYEDKKENILVVRKENAGIRNLIVGVAVPILILEQFIFDITSNSAEIYKNLLKKNRDIVHGAFVINETGSKVIFRDTLQIENLNLNELEGSLNSLSLLLSEYSEQIIKFSKY